MNGRTSVIQLIALTSAAAWSGSTRPAVAQGTSPPPQSDYIAVIVQDDVFIRAGAHDSYYPFGRLKADSLVKVVGEKQRWARVLTAGPAFETMFGFIRYRQDDTGRMRIAEDGRSALTLGRIDVLAPNQNTDGNPADSWKALLRLEADQPLTILDTSRTDREIIHRIKLPMKASGWVNLAHLRRAGPEEVRRWEALMADHLAVLGRDEPRLPVITPSPVPLSAEVVVPVRSEEEAVNELFSLGPAEDVSADSRDAVDPAPPLLVRDETMPAPPAVPPKPSVVRSADALKLEAELQDLEAAYALLRQERLESAEVEPLRGLYLDLAGRASDRAVIARYAGTRAEQLQIWGRLQEKRLALEGIRSQVRMTAEETAVVKLALDRGADYAAIGRLAASTIYDGQRLPLLMRLQDPSTGRTVGYLEPSHEYDLVSLIGQLIGIVGDKQYNGGLRVNLIQPRHIDILAPAVDDLG